MKLAKSQKTQELLEEINQKLDEMQSSIDSLFQILEEQRRNEDLREIRGGK